MMANQASPSLVQSLGQHRLGLADVDRDLFGDACECLLRKFAEGQGSSAREFLSPPAFPARNSSSLPSRRTSSAAPLLLIAPNPRCSLASMMQSSIHGVIRWATNVPLVRSPPNVLQPQGPWKMVPS